MGNMQKEINDISDPFDSTDRKPLFSFFGFSELSVYDYFLGLATGVYGRDVRSEWHQCIGGPLMMFKSLMKLVLELATQDFTDIMGVMSNFVLLQHMVDV